MLGQLVVDLSPSGIVPGAAAPSRWPRCRLSRHVAILFSAAQNCFPWVRAGSRGIHPGNERHHLVARVVQSTQYLRILSGELAGQIVFMDGISESPNQQCQYEQDETSQLERGQPGV